MSPLAVLPFPMIRTIHIHQDSYSIVTIILLHHICQSYLFSFSFLSSSDIDTVESDQKLKLETVVICPQSTLLVSI